MTRASLALTSQVDGCEVAHAIHDDCLRDADSWGAALALLFEAVGHVLRAEDPTDGLDNATRQFTELGAVAMVDLIAQLRTDSVAARRARADAPQANSMQLYCFAALEIVVDEKPLDLSAVRPRALSVLRLLALNAGRPVHREVLMDSLWRDVEPEAALHSLQVAVSSLRKLMADRPSPCIVRQGDAYQLEMGPDATCDVRLFQASLAAAVAAVTRAETRLAYDEAVRAADLYRGDLLLDEGPAEWVVGHRDALRQDLVRACTIAGESAMKLGMPQEATRMSERGLGVDRYADALWRLQIESLEQSNDKASAERVRRSWQEMMDDLGVA